MTGVAETLTAKDKPQLVYSVEECADLLRVGRSLAWQIVRRGELVSFKVGNRRLVAIEDLQAFIESRRQLSQGEVAY